MSNFEGQRRPVITISTETQKMSATDGSHLGGDRSCSRARLVMEHFPRKTECNSSRLLLKYLGGQVHLYRTIGIIRLLLYNSYTM